VTRYTAQHWGIYEVEREADGKPRLVGLRSDADPSPIGLFQLDDAVTRLRVRRPAVRRSWLERGPVRLSSCAAGGICRGGLARRAVAGVGRVAAGAVALRQHGDFGGPMGGPARDGFTMRRARCTAS